MKALKIIVGIVISAFFLYLAMRGVDLRAVYEELAQTRALPVAISVIVFLGAFVVRGLRWKVILKSTPSCPRFRELISATFIGYAANGILPLRAGEIVRGYAIARRSRTRFETALSSIVLERVMDGLTLLAILAVLLLWRTLPGWVTGIAYGGLALFGGAIVFLLVLYHLKERAITTIVSIFRRIGIKRTDAVARVLERLVEGISLLASPKGIAETILLSFSIWLLEAFTYWLVGNSVGLDLSVWAVLLALVVINFGLTLPSAPGFIGTFEYAGLLALGAFGISHDEALGFTLVLHAMFLVVLVTIGIAFAWVDYGGILTVTRDAKAQDGE